APVGIADDDGSGLRHAVDRQRLKSFALVERRGVFEALGSQRHDPEIGRGVVDHRGDYSSEPQIKAQLNGHEHDGKDDPDDGCDETQTIVEQIPRREPVDERHWRTRLLGVQTDNDEGSKVSSAAIKGSRMIASRTRPDKAPSSKKRANGGPATASAGGPLDRGWGANRRRREIFAAPGS